MHASPATFACGPRTEKQLSPDTRQILLQVNLDITTSTSGYSRYFLQVSHYRVRTQYSDFGSGADLTSLRLPVVPYFLQVRFKLLVKVTVCTPNWVKSYKCLQSTTSSWSTTSRAQTHSTFHTNSHNSQCCQHQQRLQPTSNNTTRTRHQAGGHAPTHSRSTKKTC